MFIDTIHRILFTVKNDKVADIGYFMILKQRPLQYLMLQKAHSITGVLLI